jgi:hypothetical protein
VKFCFDKQQQQQQKKKKTVLAAFAPVILNAQQVQAVLEVTLLNTEHTQQQLLNRDPDSMLSHLPPSKDLQSL